MLAPGQLFSDWLPSTYLKPFLEIGDLVEIRRVVGNVKRRIYSHWAVIIAKEESDVYVAHLATAEGDFDVSVIPEAEQIGGNSCAELTTKIAEGSKAEVRRDELNRVARNDLCRINNSLDKSVRPFPPFVIVERAYSKLGTGGYNVLFNNCEHFAKYCRYDSKESDQAALANTLLVGSLGFAVTGSVPVALAGGCVGYAISKFIPAWKKYSRYLIPW